MKQVGLLLEMQGHFFWNGCDGVVQAHSTLFVDHRFEGVHTCTRHICKTRSCVRVCVFLVRNANLPTQYTSAIHTCIRQ